MASQLSARQLRKMIGVLVLFAGLALLLVRFAEHAW